MCQNLKAVINNKAFDIDGYSLSRQVWFLLDGRVIGFEDAQKILRGSGVYEYQYHKFEQPREIFEGDRIKFFDENNNVLTGKVVWCEKRLQWVIECDKNIHGWEIYALANAGLSDIMERKFEQK